MFKDSIEMIESEKRCQLYQSCDKDLGDAILKGHTDIVDLSERELLGMIKQLTVIPVSVVVRQSDFLITRLD